MFTTHIRRERSVGDDLVLLTGTCRSCGKVTEVGYVYGRARVTVRDVLCDTCRAQPDAAAVAQRQPSGRRIGPKPSSRLPRKSRLPHSPRA